MPHPSAALSRKDGKVSPLEQMFQGNELSSTLKVCAAVDRLILTSSR